MYTAAQAQKSRSLLKNLNGSKSKSGIEPPVGHRVLRGSVASTTCTTNAKASRNPRRQSSSMSTVETPKRLVYMERRQAIPLRTAKIQTAENNAASAMPSAAAKKSASGGSILTVAQSRTKGGSLPMGMPPPVRKPLKKKSEVKIAEKQTESAELGVQTMESEILNPELIIGDVKVMFPSQCLAYQIDTDRREAKKRALLQSTRKFGPSEKKYERHLDNLREFLERGAITKRPKIIEALEVDKKCIRTMDEIMNRQIPRTESITDIKGRIKLKENEVLSLLDNVKNLKFPRNIEKTEEPQKMSQACKEQQKDSSIEEQYEDDDEDEGDEDDEDDGGEENEVLEEQYSNSDAV